VFSTLLAAAGEPDIAEKLKEGYQGYKVHIDGVNNVDLWLGETDESKRNAIFYYDESNLTAIRVGPWKAHFALKEHGTWFDPLVYPSVPWLFNLRMDPMERMDPASHEFGYIGRWMMARNLWALVPAQGIIQQHLQSFLDFPPRQKAASLSLQSALEAILQQIGEQGMQ
jgi:arylsulfatase